MTAFTGMVSEKLQLLPSWETVEISLRQATAAKEEISLKEAL